MHIQKQLQKTIFGLAMCAFVASAMPQATGQDVNPQLREAAAFLNQLSASNNPLLSSFAQEGLTKLQSRPSNLSGRQVEVPLLLQQDNTLAVLTLLNDTVMATFLVDTGSSYTVITPYLAKKLGVKITKETPRVSIITANGYINAPLVTLRNVTIGGVKVENVQAVVQNLGDDLLLSGLIGLNFFKGMDLTVKQEKLVIGLR